MKRGVYIFKAKVAVNGFQYKIIVWLRFFIGSWMTRRVKQKTLSLVNLCLSVVVISEGQDKIGVLDRVRNPSAIGLVHRAEHHQKRGDSLHQNECMF
jgi:hypothetical protein